MQGLLTDGHPVVGCCDLAAPIGILDTIDHGVAALTLLVQRSLEVGDRCLDRLEEGHTVVHVGLDVLQVGPLVSVDEWRTATVLIDETPLPPTANVDAVIAGRTGRRTDDGLAICCRERGVHDYLG